MKTISSPYVSTQSRFRPKYMFSDVSVNLTAVHMADTFLAELLEIRDEFVFAQRFAVAEHACFAFDGAYRGDESVQLVEIHVSVVEEILAGAIAEEEDSLFRYVDAGGIFRVRGDGVDQLRRNASEVDGRLLIVLDVGEGDFRIGRIGVFLRVAGVLFPSAWRTAPRFRPCAEAREALRSSFDGRWRCPFAACRPKV